MDFVSGSNSIKPKYNVGQIVSFIIPDSRTEIVYGMIIKSGRSKMKHSYISGEKFPVYYTIKLADGRRVVAEEEISKVKAATPEEFIPSGEFENMSLSKGTDGTLLGVLTIQDKEALFGAGEVVYNIYTDEKYTIAKLDELLLETGQYFYYVRDDVSGEIKSIGEFCLSRQPRTNKATLGSPSRK